MHNGLLIRCLLFLCAVGSLPETADATPSPPPDGEQIVEQAIARAKRNEENFRKKWNELRYRFRTVTETLDDEGDVEKRDDRVMETFPIQGVPYSRLVEIDGRPLTQSELEKEDDRERQFRQDMDDHKEDQSKSGDDEQVRFDENLVRKYHFHHEGEEEIHGRPAYVLSFEPKSGKLPANNRIETVLNNTAGKVWIDRETLEIQKIEFVLRGKVKFWMGMVGTLSALRGVFEREPLQGEEELWVPRKLQLFTNGRLMLESLHRNQLVEWSDYQVAPEEHAPDSNDGRS